MWAQPGLLLYSMPPKYGLDLSPCASPLFTHLLPCTALWGSPVNWFKPWLFCEHPGHLAVHTTYCRQPPLGSPSPRSMLTSTPLSTCLPRHTATFKGRRITHPLHNLMNFFDIFDCRGLALGEFHPGRIQNSPKDKLLFASPAFFHNQGARGYWGVLSVWELWWGGWQLSPNLEHMALNALLFSCG